MIALVGSSAFAGPFVQIGTGQRVFDTAVTESVVGGGVRVGFDLGVVVPFVGGNLTRVSVAEQVDDVKVPTTLGSGTAGLRVDLGSEDRPLQPFLSGGVALGRGAGRIDYEDGDEVYGIDVRVGPGGFAGAGADAALLPALWIGLEVGAEMARAHVTLREEYDGEVDSWGFDATGAWTWVDLHLVFRPGGAK